MRINYTIMSTIESLRGSVEFASLASLFATKGVYFVL